MNLHVRSLRNLFTVLCSVALLAACAVTQDDIDTWIGTVRGPGKIKAVLLSDRYADELRIHAGLALVRMEPRSEVDGVSELQNALRQLDDESRRPAISPCCSGSPSSTRPVFRPSASPKTSCAKAAPCSTR
ncbi:hypothetical protein [Sorangium sp. So ce1097]|uniref:hypothetical protein n=1 Tax=Sorangium sp. So ce1097 TaxID=3133330 RepID=UPI003F626826